MGLVTRRSRWHRSGRACAGVCYAAPTKSKLATGLVAAVSASLLFAGGAQAATPVGLGQTAGFSVFASASITNVGATTMTGDLGLDPGTSVTGAPVTLGTAHIDDGVAQQAHTDLATAITDAAGQPGTTIPGGEIGQTTFTAGVYTSTSLDLAATDTVTLDAQGDPNAVFVFQATTSTLITGSATNVQLINGAQSCNVFWEVGSSATLGSGSHFVGTVLAGASVTAGSGATIEGRLLASTSVTLSSNTITTAACAPGTTGGNLIPPPTTGTTPAPTTVTTGTPTPTPGAGTTSTTPTTGTTGSKPTGGTKGGASGSGGTDAAKAAKAKAAKQQAAKVKAAKAAKVKAAKAKAAKVKAAKVKAAKVKAAKVRAAKTKAAKTKAAKTKAARVKAAKGRGGAQRQGGGHAHRTPSPARPPTGTAGFTG